MKSATFFGTALGVLAAAVAARAQTIGGVDHALHCNGTTDYVAATAPPLAVANNFTMEFWVSPTAPHQIDRESATGLSGVNGKHFAIYPLHGTACWGAEHAGAGVSVGTNGVSVYEHAADYMPAVLVYEAPISGWTHIAVVYQDRRPSLYVNGKLVKVGIVGSRQFVHPSAGRIADRFVYGGIGGGPLGYFAGDLDNVRIWGAPRSEAAIAATAANAPDIGSERPILMLDMNRDGRGAGLELANAVITGARAATTVGTSVSPVFVLRASHIAPTRERATAPSTGIREVRAVENPTRNDGGMKIE